MASEMDDLGDEEQRFCEVLAAYFEALGAGHAPGRDELLASHPDLADQLTKFLGEEDRLLRMTRPLRLIAGEAKDVPHSGASCANGAGAAHNGARTELPTLGDYELIEPIAVGGMGAVYKARQRSLNRLVAIKLVRGGLLAGDEDLHRFRQEAEAVAQLDHPNIVPIYEVGEQNGFRYFSMKLAEGGSLAQALSRYVATPRSAAGVVATVARAVHHAHERGVLHRDLKPSNILLDRHGQPHVSDFGLAKRLNQDTELTQTGAILGTPSYMAPEQALGHRGTAGVATDVYGLGAVLYALITGRPPFVGDSILGTIEELKLRTPDPPSTINCSVDRDLQTICLKCLEKQPAHRYRSAQELADDLDRWLQGRPILARRIGLAETAVRWCRRNPRAALTMAALALLALCATIGFGIAWNAREAVAEVNRGLVSRAQIQRRKVYIADMRTVSNMIDRNMVDEATELLTTYLPSAGAEDVRGFEWYYFWRLCHPECRTLKGHEGMVYHVDFSPDCALLASCGQDGTARIWDVATGAERLVLRGHTHDVNWVEFSPDGRTLATASEDKTARLWNAATGAALQTLAGHGTEVVSVRFTPDGRKLVTGDRDAHIIVWGLAAGRKLLSFDTQIHYLESMAISLDGKTLAVAGIGAALLELETGKRKLILTSERVRINDILFFREQVGGAFGKSIRWWNTSTGQLEETWNGLGGNIISISNRRTIFDWADERGLVERVNHGLCGYESRLPTGQHGVWCVAMVPSGNTVATAGRDGTVKLWHSVRDSDRITAAFQSEDFRSAAFSADNRTVTSITGDGKIYRLNLGREEIPLPTSRLDEVKGGLVNWDPYMPHPPGSFPARGKLIWAEFSRDASTLATLCDDKTCRIWDMKSETLVRTIQDATAEKKMRLSHDGKWLSSPAGAAPEPNRIRIWSLEDTRRLESSDGNREGPWDFAPAKHCLASVFSTTGALRVEDLTTHRSWTARSRGNAGAIRCLVFSNSSKLIATGGLQQTIEIWDTDTLTPQLTLAAFSGGATQVVFSPDQRYVAATNGRDVKFWDILTGLECFTPVPSRPVQGVFFSEDGSFLALGTVGTTVPGASLIVWPAPRTDAGTHGR